MKNEKELRILMLEDSPEDIFLIERMLKKGNIPFVAQHVDTRQEFTDAIKSFRPDVVLSDHGLPQFNSLEALKICIKEKKSTPFIIVTGTMSDEFAISCLKMGADDYLLKSNLARLPQAIHRAIKEKKLEHLKRNARHALRKQNNELLKVNQELDKFVYSVSHNLRGPLASVLGLLTIVESENDSEKRNKLVGMMRQSVTRLDKTVKEILEYSQNARTEVETEPVDCTLIVEQTLQQINHLQGILETSFRCHFANDLVFWSDPYRFQCILLNLLTNAVQYRDERKKSFVEISLTVEKGIACLTVHDNGIGIEESSMNKVGSMFFRGNPISNGAGLGLYITKEIVKKLKGTFAIESRVNDHTTVTISFPVVEEVIDDCG